ncbi:hypothetical protein GCM10008957_07830 [Deinococcus ruber]|uniref:DUF1844 domain-containing protein n=2 Tax=Deinococcaceae TaxID=183710 RepID=A0A918BZ68_9DEIO|nr:hypothetical protein GCM10008957_07830 [Deinococcus ruber]
MLRGMANQDFVGLVNMLEATADAALGELTAASALLRQGGLASDPERARQTAQRSLRLLTMLAEKTRGNLDMVEADLLTGAISHLRSQLEN